MKGQLGTLEPKTPMAALGGRITLDLPKGVKDEARQRSIMAAPESAEEETRFVVDAGKERLVVMVWELFALAPTDLVEAVKADPGVEAAKRDIAAMTVAGEKIVAVRARPKAPALNDDTALVDAAFLSLPDGTVVFVAAYVNTVGLADIAGAQSLAGKILASAKAGTRSLARQAGTRKLGDLTATVPADVVHSMQQGPDFEVHRLRKLVVLGGDGAVLGAYLGFHPSLMHKQMEDGEPAMTKVKGKLFGRDIEWESWLKVRARTYEVIEPFSREHPEMQVHVFLSAKDHAGIAAMKAIAETLTLPK